MTQGAGRSAHAPHLQPAKSHVKGQSASPYRSTCTNGEQPRLPVLSAPPEATSSTGSRTPAAAAGTAAAIAAARRSARPFSIRLLVSKRWGGSVCLV